LIDLAILYEITHVWSSRQPTDLGYTSIDAFRSVNPKCCSLDRSPDHPIHDSERLARLIGMYTAVIEMVYQVSTSEDWAGTIAVDACGNFRERFGHPVGKPPAQTTRPSRNRGRKAE
jgi:hypothetical protein